MGLALTYGSGTGNTRPTLSFRTLVTDSRGRSWLALVLPFLLLILAGLWLAMPAAAGTTGKISGRVLDAKKQPIVGANIAVPEARVGAMSDAEGRYVILNVPAGTWQIRANLLGYNPVTVQGVIVSSDQTTTQDITLNEAPVQLEEVVIKAERPVVNLNLTSNLQTVNRADIERLPVQELQDIVNMKAGVVDGHFRGGRLGEVQFQVDGVSMNNPYDNKAGIRIDRSLLEEVQVVTGTFDAEYGQAMSGVVNAVLKRGSDKFRADGEAFVGGFLYGSNRIVPNDWNPTGYDNFVVNASGPAGLPKTTFLLGGRRTLQDNWITATRIFRPTDRVDSGRVTGDQKEIPLGYFHEWGGIAKISNRSIHNLELSYQAIVNRSEARGQTEAAWAYRYNPDGQKIQNNLSVVHGLDLTYTLSPKSFANLAIRQNIVDYTDWAYENLNDPRYDAAGEPQSVGDLGGGGGPNQDAFVQGVDLGRFEQYTNAWIYKGSFVRQFSSDQQLKFGGEIQWPVALRFGTPGWLVGQGFDPPIRHENEPPDFPAPATYHPVTQSAFVQDELEYNDLKLRAGIRYDSFDARWYVPSDLANPANSISGVPESHLVPTTVKRSFSPRLGVSYPVSADAALYFSYGHFTQMPPLGDIFGNADYGVLHDLQATPESEQKVGVLGNPDIKPEHTVQYQFGYKQAVTDWLGLDLTTFYKDIRDLLGVEFIQTYNDAEYARFTNVDFGNVLGFTISLDQRQRGLISSRLDYTWQRAQGNSSDPRETATRAETGEGRRPRVAPFSWDQQHTLNLEVIVSRPNDFSFGAIGRLTSGQPYTPSIETGFGGGLETNSGRKPPATLLDLRGEKHLRSVVFHPMLFARVFNVFDTRYFNGFVFTTTGSPYYSRDPVADQVRLGDPTRFYGPRRIELGVRISEL
jgi:outer membrane receptor protein involved in Fe transport